MNHTEADLRARQFRTGPVTGGACIYTCTHAHTHKDTRTHQDAFLSSWCFLISLSPDSATSTHRSKDLPHIQQLLHNILCTSMVSLGQTVLDRTGRPSDGLACSHSNLFLNYLLFFIRAYFTVCFLKIGRDFCLGLARACHDASFEVFGAPVERSILQLCLRFSVQGTRGIT